jgi:hypothetical protein
MRRNFQNSAAVVYAGYFSDNQKHFPGSVWISELNGEAYRSYSGKFWISDYFFFVKKKDR